jgi:2-amino-4-hydroxy-6-hydroxymethyldihydropteridine diphosphokinase
MSASAAATSALVTAFVGIGSNLGDAQGNVQGAILRLAGMPKTILTGQSSLFRTAPVDAGGDDYINAVVRIDTRLDAPGLLRELQALEQAYGRERPYPNAPRTLDLDILLYGQHTWATGSLTVPHPRLTLRAFALIPLLQIDPLAAIPGKGPAHSFVPDVAGQPIQKL